MSRLGRLSARLIRYVLQNWTAASVLICLAPQPYLDPEVWGEIRRAISAKIATAVAGDAAQRQAAALAADESDDESSEEEDDGDEEGDAGSDDAGRASPPLPPGKRRRV